MDWVLGLTANSVDDSETLLRILSAKIVANGAWILMRCTSPDGVVEACFEFEREASMDIYTALMATGLELSAESHLQLTQLCHCTNSVESYHRRINRANDDGRCTGRRSFEPVRIDLRILPEQLSVFEPKAERGAAEPAYRFRP